ncbi:FAD binding domain-containing protein [Mycena belliarum]|uniref:FAD binding domain-containing protein n=1 Tax=Mycena belliarum TaxID=1033014 RepID=A0AAD6XL00_9AGAR|nr:FAD binding domain-containing protein [Mycena belliae]
MAMPSPPVLIAGAGPTGLILALVLLKNGVSVRIIDREPTYRIGSRGTGVQPRTLELYDILGILPSILKASSPVPPMAIYKPGQTEPVSISTLAEWVEPTPDVPHANMLNINQDVHEEILRDHLQALSCSVELNTELRSFEQFPDHVVAEIVKTDVDGTQHVESTTFDWLVGTDGARSVVRKQLGLSFVGETREQENMAVGDMVIEEGLDPKFWHMWTVPPTFITLRSNDATSNRFSLAYSGRAAHLTETAMTREEFIEEFYAVTGRRDIKFGAFNWIANWRPNLRMVDTMRSGRVFVAGDAAHCHAPAGGQGLNSSVQDAANLGWKLALVHAGRASPALLDSYSAERTRVVKHMLALTTALFNKKMARFAKGRFDNKADSDEAKPGGDQAAKEGGKKDGDDDESAYRGGLRMLGVNYRGSAIVLEDAAADADAGAYAPPAGTRVQAAYRAPDAPGLVPVGAGAGDAPTTLFALFRVTVHTVLLFGDAAAAAPVAQQLPKDVVRSVLVLPKGRLAGKDADAGEALAAFDEVLEDREGHAYSGYGLASGGAGLTVVIVRPDGVVGAVVVGAEDVERYFRKLFA